MKLDQNPSLATILRAVSNSRRFSILSWLPESAETRVKVFHSGRARSGAEIDQIARNFNISVNTVRKHMVLLHRADLVALVRKDGKPIYHRNESMIAKIVGQHGLSFILQPPLD